MQNFICLEFDKLVRQFVIRYIRQLLIKLFKYHCQAGAITDSIAPEKHTKLITPAKTRIPAKLSLIYTIFNTQANGIKQAIARPKVPPISAKYMFTLWKQIAITIEEQAKITFIFIKFLSFRYKSKA